MAKVLLVGVDHGYGYLPEPDHAGSELVEEYAHAREPFAELLREKIRSQGATAIFEEAGSGYAVREGIRSRFRERSIPQAEADRAGIRHEFVDADTRELREAGIRAVYGFEVWEEERPRRDRFREERMAAKVADALRRDETAILVVGREHLDGVAELLERDRIEVVVHDTTLEPWARPSRGEARARRPFREAELDD